MENEQRELLLRQSIEREQRMHALADFRRSVHADRSKQLFDAGAAMHRWVMASLLLLNTGSIVAILGRDGATLSGGREEIMCWALGAALAIFSGSVRSDADDIDGLNWQSLASRDFSGPNDASDQQEFDADTTLVKRMRNTSVTLRIASIGSFAVGLAYALGYL